MLGIISGAVAGLGTITPASGFVVPWHGLVIGVVAGSICFYACTGIKLRFGYDDSLDVFGVHGMGGIVGTLLAGVFATAWVSATPDNPLGVAGLLDGNPRQLLAQCYGVVATALWSGAATLALLRLVDAVTPLRVSKEHEIAGLDVSLHGEALQ